MRIEIISGSPRNESLTRRVALHLKKLLAEKDGITADILDIREWNLPPVQTTYTSVENTPKEFKAVSERIFKADAFILVTPEYNGSYSPAMKNLLDHYPKQHRKSFGIVTASPGAMGGMRAAQNLLLLVPAFFGIASPYMLITPQVDKKFDKEGNLLDEAFQKNIDIFLTEYLWLARSVAAQKTIAA